MSGFKILTTAEVRGLTSPQWLIEDLIPEHSTSQLFGKEGSHKSFITLDMAFCVATGKSFHGKEVLQGRVLYIASEGGAPIGKRIRSWEAHNQLETEDVDFFMDEELMLDDPDSVKAALEVWKAGNYRLVIIDTLRTSSIGDEMSNKTMGAITRGMRRFQRELNTTVLIVHHSIKSSSKVYGGSNVLAANIATSIRVSYDAPGPTLIECMKQKDAELFETIVLNHKQVGESLVLTSEDLTTPVSRTATEQTMIRLIQQHPQGIDRPNFVSLCEDNGMSSQTAYRWLRKLDETGAIRSEDRKIFPLQ